MSAWAILLFFTLELYYGYSLIPENFLFYKIKSDLKYWICEIVFSPLNYKKDSSLRHVIRL